MSSARKKKENISEVASSAEDYNIKDRLDRELAWCIEQLKLGMHNKSSNIAEAMRLLRILESGLTSEPKKRQLMRATFGDYRKKMEDELKQIDAKFKNDQKKIRVKPVSSTVQCKSIFYRKSISSVVQPSEALSSNGTGTIYCHMQSDLQEPSANSSNFTFDFNSETSSDLAQVETDFPKPLIHSELSPSSFQAFKATGSEFRFCFDE